MNIRFLGEKWKGVHSDSESSEALKAICVTNCRIQVRYAVISAGQSQLIIFTRCLSGQSNERSTSAFISFQFSLLTDLRMIARVEKNLLTKGFATIAFKKFGKASDVLEYVQMTIITCVTTDIWKLLPSSSDDFWRIACMLSLLEWMCPGWPWSTTNADALIWAQALGSIFLLLTLCRYQCTYLRYLNRLKLLQSCHSK